MMIKFTLRLLCVLCALCGLASIYRKASRVRKENAEDTFMQYVLQ